MATPEESAANEPKDLESLIAWSLTQPEAERNAAIERFCRAHPSEDAAALRGAVENALRSHTLEDGRVTSPDPGQQLEQLKTFSPPPGRYQLQGEVARGGMGAILRVHDQVLGRPLAMKVILGQAEASTGTTPPVDSRVLTRFLDEAQVTGQLDHPGVVPVHELSLDAGGRVYFTMRLIKGRTADEVFHCAREHEDGWTLTRALEVILKVCDTLAYAHQKGVIHRDLKPANVMVGRFGEVYVMDWGLARVLGTPDRRDLRIKPSSVSQVQTERSRQAESDPDSPIMTMDGAVVGTPSYMPPEQAAGKIDELGPRSDVYAVGAMLYALLTGRQPYVTPGAAMSPYTVLGLVLHGPPTPVHAIDAQAPPELVAICEKAMAREQSARYPGTRELGEELRAFLENRVVRAFRTGAVAEARAWMRRNRGVAASLAALLVLGVGAFAWISVALKDASDAREQAQSRASEARASEREALARSYVATLGAASAAEREHEMRSARRYLEQTPESLRGWEWRHLWSRLDTCLAVLEGTAQGVEQACFIAGGQRVLTVGKDVLRLHDAQSGRILSTARLGDGTEARDAGARCKFSEDDRWLLHSTDPRTGIWRLWKTETLEPGPSIVNEGKQSELGAFSPDSTRLALATPGGAIRVLELQTQVFTTLSGHQGAVSQLTFSRDGKRLVSAGADATVRIWDPITGHEELVLRKFKTPVSDVVVAPDAARLATNEERGALLWDGRTGTQIAALRDQKATQFNADGSQLLVLQRRVGLLDSATGRETKDLFAPPVRFAGAMYSPGGTRIMAFDEDGGPWLWDAASGNTVELGPGGGQEVFLSAITPDDRLLLTTGAPGSNATKARIWDGMTGQQRSVLASDEPITDARFTLDGSRALTWSKAGAARIWSTSADADTAILHPQVSKAMALSPAGNWLATDAEAGVAVEIFSLSSWRRVIDSPSAMTVDRARQCAFSADGRYLVAPTHGFGLSVLDLDSHRVQTCEGFGDMAVFVDFARATGAMVSLHIAGEIRTWDCADGHLLSGRQPDEPLQCAALRNDGTVLAVTGHDRDGCFLDLRQTDSLARRRLRHPEGSICALAFNLAGTRVASAATNGAVRLWDVASGTEVARIETQANGADTIRRLQFVASDRDLVAFADPNRPVRTWDLASRRERTLGPAPLPTQPVDIVAVSPDGLWLAVRGPEAFQVHGADGRAVSVIRPPSVREYDRCVFSPDGARVLLYSITMAARPRLHDAASGRDLAVLDRPACFSDVAFAPDGKSLALSRDGMVERWRLDPVAPLSTIVCGEGRALLAPICYSADGRVLWTSRHPGEVQAWAATTDGCVERRLRPSFSTGTLSHDGCRAVFCGKSETWVCESPSGDPLLQLSVLARPEMRNVITQEVGEQAASAAAFARDDRRIATAHEDGVVRIWDAVTGAHLLEMRGHDRGATCVIFSPDGSRVVSGGDDTTVRFWEATTGRELVALRGHKAPVDRLAFAPDGTRLFSRSADGVIHIWDTVSAGDRWRDITATRAREPEARAALAAARAATASPAEAGQRLRADRELPVAVRDLALEFLVMESLRK